MTKGGHSERQSTPPERKATPFRSKTRKESKGLGTPRTLKAQGNKAQEDGSRYAPSHLDSLEVHNPHAHERS